MMTNEDLDDATQPSRHSRSVGLQIFLSYASERQPAAEEIALALKERGHRVFFDREQLPPGEGFHARIEQEVQECDLAVFLISPESIETGSYALTELGYINRRFEHPAGRVLPVLVAPTPLDGIPTYLRAVTLLQPKGNLAAEVAAAVNRLCPRGRFSKVQPILKLAQLPYAGAVGLTLVVLANTANYAGNDRTILRFIYDHVGINALRNLDLLVRPSVIFILTVGYLLGFLWLTKRFRSNLVAPKALCIAAALLAIFAANLKFGVPGKPELQKILDDKFSNQLRSWTERAFSYQDSTTGGIRGAPDYRSEPSSWATAQVIVGVLKAAEVDHDLRRHAAKIRSAFRYLDNSKAAKPLVGWGYYDNADQTITEVSSWGTLAYLMSIKNDIRDLIWSKEELPQVIAEIGENLQTIAQRQHETGGWIPIEGSSDEVNTRTYSTVMALWVLLEAIRSPILPREIKSIYETRIRNGVIWLLQNYDGYYAWVPNPNREMQTEVFIGLSAQAVYVLREAEEEYPSVRDYPNYQAAKRWILSRDKYYNDLVEKNLQGNRRTHDADVHLVGLRFTMEQSTFLWFPWSYAALSILVSEPGVSEDELQRAREARLKMSLRFEELDAYLKQEFPYVLAENLYAISSGLEWARREDRADRGGEGSGQGARLSDRDTPMSEVAGRPQAASAQARRGEAGKAQDQA